jgi:hypothetical protein
LLFIANALRFFVGASWFCRYWVGIADALGMGWKKTDIFAA